MEMHTQNYNTVTKEEIVGQSDQIHNENYSSQTKFNLLKIHIPL